MSENVNVKVNENGKLPFAKNEVVRLMRMHLDDDKMIKERVKVEMNRFLGEILKNVCERLNEYPYTTVDHEMLEECIYPYTNIERIDEERERILAHLDAIRSDCDALAMDVRRTMGIRESGKDEIFFRGR